MSDASFGEFRRQLEYKTAWYGTELVVADRWFPSSKTCSGCGSIDPDLALSDRTCACTGCGLVIDRDLNAAINSPATRGTPRLHRRYPRPPDGATPTVRAWMSRAVEPTATLQHEGALGRNQHQTSTKVCRRLEGNQEPAAL